MRTARCYSYVIVYMQCCLSSGNTINLQNTNRIENVTTNFLKIKNQTKTSLSVSSTLTVVVQTEILFRLFYFSSFSSFQFENHFHLVFM